MHPCCNGSLQKGTKVIASVELIISMLIWLLGVLAFTVGGLAATNTSTDKGDEKTGPSFLDLFFGRSFMAFSIPVILLGVMCLLVTTALLMGAVRRSQALCMVWFVLNVLLLILVVAIFYYTFSEESGIRTISTFIVVILLQSYFLWVVWAFMSELREEAAGRAYSHPKPRV